MTTDANLTNALTSQNDAIAQQINAATDGAELEQAYAMVAFVAPVWECVGYGYKVKELRNRIEKRARFLADGERNYLSTIRKNDKTRRMTESNLLKLEAMEVIA